MKIVTTKEIYEGRMEVENLLSEEFRDAFLNLIAQQKTKGYDHITLEFSSGSELTIKVDIDTDISKWRHRLWPKISMFIREEK